MCPRATWLAPSTGYTARSTLRPPPVITRPCGRCAWWRGLKTTVAVNPDCSSAARMACPAASLTPSGFPLPRNPAHASAAASVACTSSNDSSRCASKEGIPLLCCSIFVLGCLGFFQQLRGTKLHLVDPALQERRPHEIAEQRVRPVRARAELRVELARDKPRVVGELDDLDQASVGREPAEHHAPLAPGRPGRGRRKARGLGRAWRGGLASPAVPRSPTPRGRTRPATPIRGDVSPASSFSDDTQ